MKHICIVSLSDLYKDPRVLRQIQWLSGRYLISTIGFSPSGLKVNQHINLKIKASKLQKFATALSKLTHCHPIRSYCDPLKQALGGALKALSVKPDFILANDLLSLPVLHIHSKKVVVDLHEYAPREWENILRWKWFTQGYVESLCRNHLKKASASFTVCKGIAKEYQRNFNITPAIVTNAPNFFNLRPSIMEDDKVRIIQHGVATPSRKIEEMIYLMEDLEPRFHLDLILVPGDENYIRKLRLLASKNHRIQIKPIVDFQALVPFSNDYDIGLFFLPPTNFNYLHALPNKFFEFIQARLAIAIGPSPEMHHYVKKYDLGIVSDTFCRKQLAKQLNALSKDQIEKYKQNAHKAAQTLHAKHNEKIFLKTIEEVFR